MKCHGVGALNRAILELSLLYKMPIAIYYHCVFLEAGNWREGEQVTVVDSSNVCLNILTRHMVTTLPCLHVRGPMETLVCTC